MMDWRKNLLSLSNRVANTIGMSRRAGKLLMGFDMVKEAIIANKTVIVGVCTNLSPKSLKELNFTAQKQGVVVHRLPCTMEELQAIVGRKVGIIAITDKGLANKLTMLLAEMPAEETTTEQ